jgi:hypothetical protein
MHLPSKGNSLATFPLHLGLPSFSSRMSGCAHTYDFMYVHCLPEILLRNRSPEDAYVPGASRKKCILQLFRFPSYFPNEWLANLVKLEFTKVTVY